jgi:hypothetical protein
MTKPDFSGTWKFNPARSSLQIPAPESTIFVIKHREPHFRLERTHIFGGNSDTFSIDLTTDGNTVVRTHAGLEINATLRWEGDALVFDSKLERDGKQATNIVRYKLSDDGQSFIADEKFSSKELNYENKWLLERE